VLFDEGMTIMKNYAVNYAVDTATIERYKKYSIDFDVANGSNGANLPVPAVYVITPDGRVTYRFFNSDYTKRPSVKEIINHL
jgi:peroxiredoxin